MIIDTIIQKIEEKVKQIDGTYITKHRQTSADIVLYDTGEKDKNGNIVYSEVQSEIDEVKKNNTKNDETIKDMALKQKSISDLFHSITKVSNNLIKTSTSEIPTSYGVAKYIEENIESYVTGTIDTFPQTGSNKLLYIDIESNIIYRYNPDNSQYIPIGSGGINNIVFIPFSSFPLIGDSKTIYVDISNTEELKLYRWNGENYINNSSISNESVSSIDIPVALLSAGWTGTTAPYTQTVTVPQVREGMTPILCLSNNADSDMLYAYGLIVDYTASYGQMTFYAADLPSVNVDIVLKGVPAQQLEYVDNTVIVPVSASGFELNEDHGRYEQTITVEGMTAGLGGNWDIVRSGPVLTVAESKIVKNITDINRLDGAVKIVCLAPPEQDYMIYLQGTQTPVNDDTPILSNMQGWFDKVNQLDDKLNNNTVYSYDETLIGTWIDGKPLYRKMINFGTLPNNDAKLYPIDNDKIKHCHINVAESFMYQTSMGIYSDTFSFNEIFYIGSVGYIANSKSIRISTINANASRYSVCVCIEYTKTTD